MKSRDDCPADEIREAPRMERVKAVDKMPEEELEALLERHSECAKEREG